MTHGDFTLIIGPWISR